MATCGVKQESHYLDAPQLWVTCPLEVFPSIFYFLVLIVFSSPHGTLEKSLMLNVKIALKSIFSTCLFVQIIT